jgi:hypothetical protein
MKFRLFILIFILLTTIPFLSFPQQKNRLSVHSTIEILSTQEGKEYEFEICYAASEESHATPLKVEKLKTPFKLDFAPYSVIAIIRSENFSKIESSIIAYDKTGKEISSVTGSSPRFILRKNGDIVEFSNI